MLTDNIDIDREVLFKLQYGDLVKICEMNKFFLKHVCNPLFWKLKISKDFPYVEERSINPLKLVEKLTHRKDFELYKHLVKRRRLASTLNLKDIYSVITFNWMRSVVENPIEDPSDNQNFAIQHAAASGYKDIVILLLEDERVNPAANENFAIWIADSKGYKDIVDLLLPRVVGVLNKNFPN